MSSIEEKFKVLKDQVIWAVNHRGLVNDDGIFQHLRKTLHYLETGSWEMPAETLEAQPETVELSSQPGHLQQLKVSIAAHEPMKLLCLPREEALKILHHWRDLARKPETIYQTLGTQPGLRFAVKRIYRPPQRKEL